MGFLCSFVFHSKTMSCCWFSVYFLNVRLAVEELWEAFFQPSLGFGKNTQQHDVNINDLSFWDSLVYPGSWRGTTFLASTW